MIKDIDVVAVIIVGIVAAIFGLFVGAAVGSRNGDQTTLRDCAVRSIAKLDGGGSIKCSVIQETAP